MKMRSTSKSSKKSITGENLLINDKVLFISSFYGRKPTRQLGHTHSRLIDITQRSPPFKKQKIDSCEKSPKYKINDNSINLIEKEPSNKAFNFRKLLKHFSFNSDIKKDKDQILFVRIPSNLCKKNSLFEKNQKIACNMQDSALLGVQNCQIIKQQLKDKLHKTHLSFKQKRQEESIIEENKKRKARSYVKRKLKKADNIHAFFNQVEKFQPWVRHKMGKDLFQLEDNGYNYEYF